MVQLQLQLHLQLPSGTECTAPPPGVAPAGNVGDDVGGVVNLRVQVGLAGERGPHGGEASDGQLQAALPAPAPAVAEQPRPA